MRVFISYSHDSNDHKKWVSQLASDLRENGIATVFDENTQLGQDLPAFMEQMADTDRVLLVCTEKYVEKANAGQGGVGYEKRIMTADLLRQGNDGKYIPLIRQAGTDQMPTFLGAAKYINFSDPEFYQVRLDELLKDMTGSKVAAHLTAQNQMRVASTVAEAKDLTFDGIVKVILESDPKNDWVRSSMGSRQVCSFKAQPHLRLEYDYDDDVVDNFNEKWAVRHPDPKATSYFYYLFYGSSVIDRQLLVSVDGGRATLPAPDLRDMKISEYQYRFGKIFDPSKQYEDYLGRSGITVRTGAT